MSSIGPQIPAHLVSASAENSAGESDEDDYTPALPPDLAAARKAAGPSEQPTPGPSMPPSSPSSLPPRRVMGPTFPAARGPDSDADSDSDGEVGPQPLPADAALARATARDVSGVEAFLEKEARRRKHVEEAQQPKKLVREAWMLVPPKAGDLLGSLDPTKLKARQFGRGAAVPARDGDASLWTETPAERQQRLADEVSGRKRRAVNADPVEDVAEERKRHKRDAAIRKGVDEHTRKVRGPALVDAHMEREAQRRKGVDEPPPAIWDHSRDMSLGGRLMDDKQRQKLVHDAKALGDRFGAGKSGGFL